jgi:hypothetical protein
MDKLCSNIQKLQTRNGGRKLKQQHTTAVSQTDFAYKLEGTGSAANLYLNGSDICNIQVLTYLTT